MNLTYDISMLTSDPGDVLHGATRTCRAHIAKDKVLYSMLMSFEVLGGVRQAHAPAGVKSRHAPYPDFNYQSFNSFISGYWQLLT